MKFSFGIVSMVILAIVFIGLGFAMYFLLPPSPSPTSGVEKTPKIVTAFHTTETVETVNFFIVRGIVQNNLTTNIRSVNVTSTFFDSENKTIGSNNAGVFSQILKPGQKAPFEIYFLLSPDREMPRGYLLTTSCFETSEEPVSGMDLMNLSTSLSSDGYYIVQGAVCDKGIQRAYAVSVFGAYYDAEGNLVWMAREFVATEIEAGSQMSFELSSAPYKFLQAPENYELFIYVHSFTPPFNMNYIMLAFIVTVFVVFVVYMKRRRRW